MKKKYIVFANLRGGVGKSTCAVNFAASLFKAGYRVLLIDLDQTAGSTYLLIQDAEKYIRSTNLDEIQIVRLRESLTGCLDISPGGDKFCGLDFTLANRKEPYEFLSCYINERDDDYDFIILDCPADFGIVSISAIIKSDIFIVPTLASVGTMKTLPNIERLLFEIGTKKIIDRILVTMYHTRQKEDSEALAHVRKSYPGRVFCSPIHKCTKLAKLASSAVDVINGAPTCSAAEDFQKVIKETLYFLEKDGIPEI